MVPITQTHQHCKNQNLRHCRVVFSPQRLILASIHFYQKHLSPLKPPSCRFEPTCSAYAKQAILRYGWRYGSWLAWNRILRCHPFHPGGYDPVT